MLQKSWPLLVMIGVGLVALVLIGLEKADTTKSKVEIEDLRVGYGTEASPGNRVTVDYIGRLADGQKVFDSTKEQGKKPFTFIVGSGEVIKGWGQAVTGMKVGGKRKILIPAKMAYGASGFKDVIPPNADLEFEVELLKVEPESALVEAEETGPERKVGIEEIQLGDGPVATPGNRVTVHYTGWLASNQKVFDTSKKEGRGPFSFTLGAGKVIKGWDQGVAGMKVGGKRRLLIPAKLGYGKRGAGADIPPNSDLVFEVELLKVD